MFSGIVEELGEVNRIQHIGRNSLLELQADKLSRDASLGDSIAVNGTCLTVVKKREHVLGFEVMPQTLQATNLGNLRIRDKINLEQSLKVGDRISGHFVYGHIDCVGIIRKKTFVQDNLCFEIAVPCEFIASIITKGAIAIDGISLTVQSKKGNIFCVYIIPHTLKNTTLGFKHPSDKVNIETDKLLSS